MQQHIIVIGAGAAGLMAGIKLLTHGHRVTLLEARDRVGGRIHTISPGNFSIPVDAGAEFIHGSQPLTRKLLEEAGGKSFVLKGNMYQVADGDISKGGFDEHWPTLMKELRKLEHDIDIGSFLDNKFPEEKHRGLRENVRGFVEGYDAADLSRVSAFALREEWEQTDDEDQHHIKGGYRIIIDHLLSKFLSGGGKLLKSCIVTEVQWRKGRVVVQAGETIVEGEKVLITVPLGVLQNEKIRFTPALTDHLRLWKQCGFGGVIKFMFEFQNPFWEEVQKRFRKFSFIFSDAPIPTWWSQRPDETPLLTGWWGGPSTFNDEHSEHYLYEKALSSLAYIFKVSETEIASHVKAYHIADWVTDPFSLGAYAYATVLSRASAKLMSAPVDETIFFAGEAFYHGPAMGTVEAALASAQKACNDIK